MPSFAKKLSMALAHRVEYSRSPEVFDLSNKSPYETIYTNGVCSLRCYHSHKKSSQKTPILLVPPLAANAMIFDLMPDRSVVQYFQDKGFEVYLIDWGHVSRQQSAQSFSTYIEEWFPHLIEAMLDHSEAPQYSIFSYCMGGLLSLIYAATTEDAALKNLVLLASPIDIHESGKFGKAFGWMSVPIGAVMERFSLSMKALPAQVFHVPGDVCSLAFKATSPTGVVRGNISRWVNYWDRHYLQESYTKAKWFDQMFDYPGAVVRDMFSDVFLRNRFVEGSFRLGDIMVDLSKVRCSLMVITGEEDALVSKESAETIFDLVTSKDVCAISAPGGHAGVLAGESAIKAVWKPAAAWFAERDECSDELSKEAS